MSIERQNDLKLKGVTPNTLQKEFRSSTSSIPRTPDDYLRDNVSDSWAHTTPKAGPASHVIKKIVYAPEEPAKEETTGNPPSEEQTKVLTKEEAEKLVNDRITEFETLIQSQPTLATANLEKSVDEAVKAFQLPTDTEKEKLFSTFKDSAGVFTAASNKVYNKENGTYIKLYNAQQALAQALKNSGIRSNEYQTSLGACKQARDEYIQSITDMNNKLKSYITSFSELEQKVIIPFDALGKYYGKIIETSNDLIEGLELTNQQNMKYLLEFCDKKMNGEVFHGILEPFVSTREEIFNTVNYINGLEAEKQEMKKSFPLNN